MKRYAVVNNQNLHKKSIKMTANLVADADIDRKLYALTPDPHLPQPVAIQFFQKLRIAVCAGYWLPGEPLPAADVIAAVVALPQADVQAALDLLRDSNWLVKTDAGYEITPKIEQPVSRLSSLSDMLKARGYVPGSHWLSRMIVPPDMDEQWRLNLQTGTRVARLERVRTANFQIIGFERTSLPALFMPDPELVGNSLYQYMTEHQIIIARAVEEIDAVICDAAMAERSGLPEGIPLLRLTRVSYLQNGQAVELTYSFFRSDYYHYVVELDD
jgi:GntR family transcriptional regulator